MKIVNKITLLFLLVATMITVVSTGSFYFVAKNQLRDLIYMQLETTINSRMHHIETYLDMLELAVAQLSKSIVLENFLKGIKDGSRKKEAFEIAMKRLKNTKEVNPYVYEFLLLDAKGKIVAATLENDIGLDKSDDAFFVGAQKHTYIKDAYFSEALKIPLIATSAPIFNSLTGEFLGVVVSRIKLDALSKIVTDSTGLGRTGELYIVNKYGYIFTPSRFSEETFLKKKIDSLNLDNCRRYKNRENALEIEKRTGIFADYRGTEVLGTNRYIPKMQWSVLAEIDTNEVFAPLKKITILFTVVLLLVLLSFWLMSWFMASYISLPIHRLHQGTEIIASGNLDYKVGIDNKDEIGQLSRAFDQMTVDLKKSQEDLKGWGQTLEERVKERTKELNQAQEATLNILEDLTEEKEKVSKYSRDLENAIKVKSDFTSMVSHELRTPLTAIKEGIAIVSDGSAGALNEEQKEFLDVAKRNVDRLARLINDVLDFQKLESGKMVFNTQENDMNSVVREIVKNMMPVSNKKGLGLILALDDKLPLVRFDRDKIIQVLTNLVNNALKFTEKGNVTIATSLGDNIIRVSVKDTGPGIKKEDLPRLFRQFEQLDKSSERKTSGTGLGLAISKEIIEKHKGKIWADSEPGKGTTFSFVLPVKERRIL